MSKSLAIGSAKATQKVQPNLLPCKIAYNGPVKADSKYWSTQAEADGSKTTYFRGRKLQGKDVRLPDGYSGVVLQKTDRTIVEAPQPREDQDDMSDLDEPPQQVSIIEQIGTFNSIAVWDHESIPESGQNPYLKAVEEWTRMAQAIHGQQ